MRPIIKKVAGIVSVATVLIASAYIWQAYSGCALVSESKSGAIGVGDAGKLLAAYKQWKVAYTRDGGGVKLFLPLIGYSVRFTKATGQAVINLVDGSVSVKVSGLPGKDSFAVWMVEHRSGVANSTDHSVVNLGTLKSTEGGDCVQVQATPKVPTGFELGQVIVARADQDPQKAGLLFGSPSLFQKIYYNENHGSKVPYGDVAEARPGSSQADSGLLCAATRFLIPLPAYAGPLRDKWEFPISDAKTLVDEGERIFFEEKFDGNGRTCGTCHPAENNFTLDPEFIATLPDSNPLFVAEYDPELKDLEDPELMRRFALIRENVDGFEDPTHKFVMRGVPHTLGLSVSLLADPATPGQFPVQMTGWAADGAPGTGSLREFAVGAVRQHFTKSLNRIEGSDFRFPTTHELDALEAFQLSLGCQEDLDLSTMQFSSEFVERGKQIFLNTDPNNPQAGKCQNCHGNAGAIDSIVLFNANFDTGVEALVDQPARLFDPSIPIDGGLGTEPNTSGGFGNGTFNIVSLIEAADTPPFFHNNAVNTIEESVGFFNSDAFNNTFIAQIIGKVKLEATQVQAVAALLRVLNALDNIRSSDSYAERVRNMPLWKGKKLLELAASETEDAIKVLKGGVFLHQDAVGFLERARGFEKQTFSAMNTRLRNRLIDQAMSMKKDAWKCMVL